MPTASSPRVWFITGTSQGFGLELVKVALDRGDSVVATSRTPDKITAAFPAYKDKLLALAVDLASDTSVTQGVNAALTKFGRLDVLVNNAGFGIVGAVEETSEAEIEKVFQLNVHGLLRVTRAILPHLRKQKSGHIVNLSSIGGLIGLPGFGIYNATKFAVEGLSEAMAAELAPLNIKVTIVEPGPFRTNFLGDSLTAVKTVIEDYTPTAGETRKYATSRNGQQPGDPVKAAEAIFDVVQSANPPLHLVLGAMAYQRAKGKFEGFLKELDTWKETTLGADFK